MDCWESKEYLNQFWEFSIVLIKSWNRSKNCWFWARYRGFRGWVNLISLPPKPLSTRLLPLMWPSHHQWGVGHLVHWNTTGSESESFSSIDKIFFLLGKVVRDEHQRLDNIDWIYCLIKHVITELKERRTKFMWLWHYSSEGQSSIGAASWFVAFVGKSCVSVFELCLVSR